MAHQQHRRHVENAGTETTCAALQGVCVLACWPDLRCRVIWGKGRLGAGAVHEGWAVLGGPWLVALGRSESAGPGVVTVGSGLRAPTTVRRGPPELRLALTTHYKSPIKLAVTAWQRATFDVLHTLTPEQQAAYLAQPVRAAPPADRAPMPPGMAAAAAAMQPLLQALVGGQPAAAAAQQAAVAQQVAAAQQVVAAHAAQLEAVQMAAAEAAFAAGAPPPPPPPPPPAPTSAPSAAPRQPSAAAHARARAQPDAVPAAGPQPVQAMLAVPVMLMPVAGVVQVPVAAAAQAAEAAPEAEPGMG